MAAPSGPALEARSDRFSADEHGHDRLLNVQTILSLVPHAALRTLDHIVRHFLTAVRRQTVQKDRGGIGALHELRIDGESGERLLTLLLLLLLAHRRPDVGIHHVRTLDCLLRIAHHANVRDLLRARKEMIGGLEPLRARNREIEAESIGSVYPRVRHVVAVTYPRE